MGKRGGIRKVVVGGKIEEAFNIEEVRDEQTGKLVKQAVVVRRSEDNDKERRRGRRAVSKRVRD